MKLDYAHSMAMICLMIAAPGVAMATDGKAVYDGHCAACHQADGNGSLGLAPPLQGTLGKRAASPVGRRYIAGIMIAGLAGKLESRGVTYSGIMPTWAALSDDELAAVANFVLGTFNADQLAPDFEPLAPAEFAALRSARPAAKDLRAWRNESEPAGTK